MIFFEVELCMCVYVCVSVCVCGWVLYTTYIWRWYCMVYHKRVSLWHEDFPFLLCVALSTVCGCVLWSVAIICLLQENWTCNRPKLQQGPIACNEMQLVTQVLSTI